MHRSAAISLHHGRPNLGDLVGPVLVSSGRGLGQHGLNRVNHHATAQDGQVVLGQLQQRVQAGDRLHEVQSAELLAEPALRLHGDHARQAMREQHVGVRAIHGEPIPAVKHDLDEVLVQVAGRRTRRRSGSPHPPACPAPS